MKLKSSNKTGTALARRVFYVELARLDRPNGMRAEIVVEPDGLERRFMPKVAETIAIARAQQEHPGVEFTVFLTREIHTDERLAEIVNAIRGGTWDGWPLRGSE